MRVIDIEVILQAEIWFTKVRLTPLESILSWCDFRDLENPGDRFRVPRGRDTRQEDVEGSPTQSRLSPTIQRTLRLEPELDSNVAG